MNKNICYIGDNNKILEYDGIGLTDCNIAPHLDFNNTKYLKEILSVSKLRRTIGLPNNSFIIIDNGKEEIVGDYYYFDNEKIAKTSDTTQKKIVAIGGGENGRRLSDGSYAPYETEPMDEEIIKLTGKDKPNFLFLAHSQVSLEIQQSYYETMKKIYGDKFGCNCKDLKTNELNDLELVKEKIAWADIIYEGGGDTLTMIDLWHKTGFDQVLYKSWLDGKVMCGVSAGAICWFTSCNSDSLIIQNGIEAALESVTCLNWINAHVTPHCDEPGRYDSTKEQLRENNLVGIMLSNCSAIEIIDDKYRIITSEVKGHDIKTAYAIKGYFQGDKYYEEKIDLSSEFKPLKELLSKNKE